MTTGRINQVCTAPLGTRSERRLRDAGRPLLESPSGLQQESETPRQVAHWTPEPGS